MNDWLYRPLWVTPGTLTGFGYATGPAAQTRLDALLSADAGTLLLDIRYRPACRWSAHWHRSALAERYGPRYAWVQALGNRNYQHREQGILLGPTSRQALAACVQLAASGLSLVLLCACRDESTCHRQLVLSAMREWLCTERLWSPVSLDGSDDEAGRAAWVRALEQASSTLGCSSGLIEATVQDKLKHARNLSFLRTEQGGACHD